MPALATQSGAIKKVLLFIASLLIINHLGRPFELILVGLRIPALITTVGVVAVVATGAMRKLYSSVSIALCALLTWMVLCVPFSLWQAGSASYVLWYVVFWLSLILLLADAPSTPRSIMSTAGVVAFTCTLYIVVGALLMDTERLYGFGTFGNADDIALMGGYTVPFVLIFAMKLKRSWARNLMTILLVSVLVYMVGKTATRTAILGFAAMIAVYFFQGTTRQKVSVILGSAVCAVFLYFLLPQSAVDRLATIVDSLNEERVATMSTTSEAMASTRQRRELFQDTVDATLAHPVFGVGPGQFQVYRFDYLKKLYFPSHNTYGQIASETGLPGLLLYVTFLASILYSNRRSRKILGSATDPDALQLKRISVHLDAALAYFAVCAFFMTCDRHPHQFVIAGLSIAVYSLSKARLRAPASVPLPAKTLPNPYMYGLQHRS